MHLIAIVVAIGAVALLYTYLEVPNCKKWLKTIYIIMGLE